MCMAVVRRSLYVHGCSEEVTVCAIVQLSMWMASNYSNISILNVKYNSNKTVESYFC